MKPYTVTLYVSATLEVQVKALSAEEADDAAQEALEDDFPADDITHLCVISSRVREAS